MLLWHTAVWGRWFELHRCGGQRSNIESSVSVLVVKICTFAAYVVWLAFLCDVNCWLLDHLLISSVADVFFQGITFSFMAGITSLSSLARSWVIVHLMSFFVRQLQLTSWRSTNLISTHASVKVLSLTYNTWLSCYFMHFLCQLRL